MAKRPANKKESPPAPAAARLIRALADIEVIDGRPANEAHQAVIDALFRIASQGDIKAITYYLQNFLPDVFVQQRMPRHGSAGAGISRPAEESTEDFPRPQFDVVFADERQLRA